MVTKSRQSRDIQAREEVGLNVVGNNLRTVAPVPSNLPDVEKPMASWNERAKDFMDVFTAFVFEEVLL